MLLSNTPSGGARPLPTGPTTATASVFLSESTDASAYGSNVTLVARVISSAATGSAGAVVNFIDQQATGNVLLASVPVQNNTALFSWSSASVADHQIVAEIAPSETLPAAVSEPVPLAVSPATTQVRLVATGSKIVATVAANASVATGTVSFFAGTRELATVHLSRKGTAALPTNILYNAKTPLVAAYNGCGEFFPSTSSTFAPHRPMISLQRNFSLPFGFWRL
jgi:Bacterial Ig-like domain (group 3)